LHKNAFHHASQCNGRCSDTSLKVEVFTWRGAETWGFHESPSFPKSKR
jgi:hypothetical protein